MGDAGVGPDGDTLHFGQSLGHKPSPSFSLAWRWAWAESLCTQELGLLGLNTHCTGFWVSFQLVGWVPTRFKPEA